MTHPVKYSLIFFFLISNLILSQTIESISVEGNRNFSSSDYLDWSNLTPGQKIFPGVLDSIKFRISRELAVQGYLNASFNNSTVEFSDDSQKVKIKIGVNEGDPSYIENIFFSGADSSDSSMVLPNFDFLKGQIFRSSDLQQNISQALIYYEDNGYPFVKIIISSIYFYTDSSDNDNYADIHLKIEKGSSKSKIDRIEIAGNTKTRSYVITRELRIEKDQEYSQKFIDELPGRLNRLRFFDPVGPPQFYVDKEGKGVLLIKVKEKETNNFDGLLGYVPPAQNEKTGYLTGLVNVSLRNLFGTGRAAAIRWQQYNRYSQELELKYLEPWLFGYPFNLTGNLYQKKQDSSYVQRKISGDLEYLATETISASINIASEVTIPTESTTSVFTVYNSSAITTGISFKIDSRDDPYSPTTGILFENSFSYSRKKIKGPAKYLTPNLQTSISLQRIIVGFSIYDELFRRQVAALSLHGEELRGTFFEESDLFRLGGTNTLRGYREDQFLGSRVFWSNLEYRFLLSRRTYVFLFLDTGYYLRKADQERNILKSEGFKIGYGLGLNLETSLGVLGVSYALAKGHSFSDGLIHFGLVSEF